MIDSWAEKMAIFMKERNDGVVSVPVMKFAFIIMLDVLFVIVLVLALGTATHKLPEAFLALFGFAILRFFSGGVHVKTSLNCIVISVTLMCLIIYTPLSVTAELWLQSIASLLVVIFAPAYIANHIRIKTNKVPLLRIVSIIIVLSNFYFGSLILAKAFFIQALTLIELRKGGEKK